MYITIMAKESKNNCEKVKSQYEVLSGWIGLVLIVYAALADDCRYAAVGFAKL